MRRAHVRTTTRVTAADVPAAVASTTPVLRQGNGSLQPGTNHHTERNQRKFSEDRIAKDKARHMGTLPAASEAEAARIARIQYTRV
jgi:hypothetical protein